MDFAKKAKQLMECFNTEDKQEKKEFQMDMRHSKSYSLSVEESNIDRKLQKTFSTRKALQEKLKAFEEKMKRDKQLLF